MTSGVTCGPTSLEFNIYVWLIALVICENHNFRVLMFHLSSCTLLNVYDMTCVFTIHVILKKYITDTIIISFSSKCLSNSWHLIPKQCNKHNPSKTISQVIFRFGFNGNILNNSNLIPYTFADNLLIFFQRHSSTMRWTIPDIAESHYNTIQCHIMTWESIQHSKY